jgi:hypothetical protein
MMVVKGMAIGDSDYASAEQNRQASLFGHGWHIRNVQSHPDQSRGHSGEFKRGSLLYGMEVIAVSFTTASLILDSVSANAGES